MTDGSMRASDAERESVVAALRDAYTEGRLTLDEFTDRTADAYAGRTWDDLRGLTADLPVQPVLGPAEVAIKAEPQEPVPARAPLAQPQPAPLERPARKPRPMGLLLPVVLLWAVIAAANNNPSAAAALSVLFICLLTVRIANSGRW
jgi:hypothetical protein